MKILKVHKKYFCFACFQALLRLDCQLWVFVWVENRIMLISMLTQFLLSFLFKTYFAEKMNFNLSLTAPRKALHIVEIHSKADF